MPIKKPRALKRPRVRGQVQSISDQIRGNEIGVFGPVLGILPLGDLASII